MCLAADCWTRKLIYSVYPGCKNRARFIGWSASTLLNKPFFPLLATVFVENFSFDFLVFVFLFCLFLPMSYCHGTPVAHRFDRQVKLSRESWQHIKFQESTTMRPKGTLFLVQVGCSLFAGICSS
jgi:hypothetical protein